MSSVRHVLPIALVALACTSTRAYRVAGLHTRPLTHSRIAHPRACIVAADDGEGPLGALSKIGESIGKLFKPKDEAEKKKEAAIAKRQREVDKSVDTMLRDTGIFGALAAPLMKSVGGMMAAAVAEQSRDLEEVLARLDSALLADNRIKSALGRASAGDPVSQGFSSMNVNGQVRKQVSLIVPIQGERASGTAQVQALIDGDGAVREMQTVVSAPGLGQIRLADGPGGGSAGGSAGDVIDVQVIED